jgi:hypothetical protein
MRGTLLDVKGYEKDAAAPTMKFRTALSISPSLKVEPFSQWKVALGNFRKVSERAGASLHAPDERLRRMNLPEASVVQLAPHARG